MTASTSDRVRSLRTAAHVLRKIDEIDEHSDYDQDVRNLHDLADELEHAEPDDLGAARIREIRQHVTTGLPA